MITNKKEPTPPLTSINKRSEESLEKLLDQKQTAELLGVSPGTLSVWRATKRYPALKYIKVGASVRYSPADVQEFLRNRTVGVSR